MDRLTKIRHYVFIVNITAETLTDSFIREIYSFTERYKQLYSTKAPNSFPPFGPN